MNKLASIQPRDIVLSVIGKCSPHKEFGRTSLQKVTYLASLVLQINLGHHAYYYGPYSGSVESDAEALVLGGFITETVELSGFSQRGFPIKKYKYSMTEAGERRLERVSEVYPEQFQVLEDFVERIDAVVGSLEQRTLSAVAKTLYIAKEQDKPVSTEEVKTLALDLGWNLTVSKIEQVTQILSDLNLVQVVTA